MFGIQ